jgi:hypothetical protein
MSRVEPSWEPVPPSPALARQVSTHELEVEDGVVLSGSDPHYRPDAPPSTAHRALVALASRFAEEGTLKALILNGDVFDFPKISKHNRIGWEAQPSTAEEIAEGQERMAEIAEAAGPGVELIMTLGNHDSRFDTHLSQHAAHLEGVLGFALRDHIDPRWLMTWQIEINPRSPAGVIVKHRHRCGVGAGRANVLAAGRSVATGHTHQLNITRVSNSLGHSWGVDTGTMAALNSPAFTQYTEMASTSMSNWASGFAVFTFRNGLLLPPELVVVTDEARGEVAFRGELIVVGDQRVLN